MNSYALKNTAIYEGWSGPIACLFRTCKDYESAPGACCSAEQASFSSKACERYAPLDLKQVACCIISRCFILICNLLCLSSDISVFEFPFLKMSPSHQLSPACIRIFPRVIAVKPFHLCEACNTVPTLLLYPHVREFVREMSVYGRAGAPSLSARPAAAPAGGARPESSTLKALRELKTGIDSNAKFGKMVGYSVECMGRMATDRNAVEDIARSGCVASTLNALKTAKNPSNVELQLSLNKALLRACDTRPHSEACAQLVSESIDGDFAPFANSIFHHEGRDVLMSNAQLMRKMGSVADPTERARNVAEMKRHGIYDALAMRALQTPDSDPDLLAELLNALATGAHDPDVAQMLIDKGLFEKVMAALAANPTHKALALAAANLIAAAASAGPHIVEQLRALGLIDVLAKLCQQFPHFAALQAAVARAMALLAGDNDVTRVLAVLRTPDLSWTKLAEATAQLATMLLAPALVPGFHAAGGRDVLYPLLKRAAEAICGVGGLQDPMLVAAFTQIALAMARSVAGSEEYVYAALKAGVAQPLARAVSALGVALAGVTMGSAPLVDTQLDALAAGIAAIRALVTRPENVTYLERAGALVGALRAALPHLAHEGVQRAVTGLVDALLEHGMGLTAGTARTASTETVEAMVAAVLGLLRAHRDDARTVESGCEQLGRLAVDAAVEMVIIAQGGGELLVELISQHGDDEDTIVAALKAVDLAAMLAEGCERLLKTDIEALLAQLGRKHKNSGAVQELINKITGALAAHRARTVPPAPRAPAVPQPPVAAVPGGMDPALSAMLADMSKFAGGFGVGLPAGFGAGLGGGNGGVNERVEHTRNIHHRHGGAGDDDGANGAGKSKLSLGGIPINFAVPEEEEARYGKHLLDAMNKIQGLITARQPGRLLNLYEMLLTPAQASVSPVDRDFLLGVVLAAVATLADEAADEEAAAGLDGSSGAVAEGEGSPVLWELLAALADFNVLDRILAAAVRHHDKALPLLAIVVEDAVTVLALARRPETDRALEATGLDPADAPGADAEMGKGRTQAGRRIPAPVVRGALERTRAAVQQMAREYAAGAAQRREAAAAARARRAQTMKDLVMMGEQRRTEMEQQRREEAAAASAAAMAERRQEMQQMVAEARQKVKDIHESAKKAADERMEMEVEATIAAARMVADARIVLEKALAEGKSGVDAASAAQQVGMKQIRAPAVLDEESREFLIVGGMLTKHGKMGPASRHVYVTPNTEYFVFKDLGVLDVKRRHMIRVTRISEILPGRRHTRLNTHFAGDGTGTDKSTGVAGVVPGSGSGSGPSRKAPVPLGAAHRGSVAQSVDQEDHDERLRRASTLNSGGYGSGATNKAYEGAACFTVCGIDLDGNARDLGFEASSPEEAKQWLRHLNALHAFARASNRFQDDNTMIMQENPLHVLEQNERNLETLRESIKNRRTVTTVEDDDDELPPM